MDAKKQKTGDENGGGDASLESLVAQLDKLVDSDGNLIDGADESVLAALREKYKEELKEIMKEKGDRFEEMAEHEEAIGLDKAGWKERYYSSKYPDVPEAKQKEELIKPMVEAYVQGICWVAAYYFDKVASWTWFYPYHYAPFSSDFIGLEDMDITFEEGTPFKPFS